MYEVVYESSEGTVSELLSEIEKVRSHIHENLLIDPDLYVKVYTDRTGYRKRIWIDDLDELRRQAKRDRL